MLNQNPPPPAYIAKLCSNNGSPKELARHLDDVIFSWLALLANAQGVEFGEWYEERINTLRDVRDTLTTISKQHYE